MTVADIAIILLNALLMNCVVDDVHMSCGADMEREVCCHVPGEPPIKTTLRSCVMLMEEIPGTIPSRPLPDGRCLQHAEFGEYEDFWGPHGVIRFYKVRELYEEGEEVRELLQNGMEMVPME